MAFDARAAKLLAPGEHYTMSDCPGLRFEVSSTTRAWIYRYKSPVDGKMRQVKIGAWPAVSINAAKVEWEKLRDQRARGEDPAAERRAKRARENEEKEAARAKPGRTPMVRTLVDFYLTGHVERKRKQKGIRRDSPDLELCVMCDLPRGVAGRIWRSRPGEGHPSTGIRLAAHIYRNPRTSRAGSARAWRGVGLRSRRGQTSRGCAQLVAGHHAGEASQQGTCPRGQTHRNGEALLDAGRAGRVDSLVAQLFESGA